jgi:predicted DsbA family dithiol-disulfide isomerase
MQIDIWSDFACPWCALGLYRLDAALAEFEHADAVSVVHRAFELDPRAPAHRDLSMEQVLTRKYGMSPAQVKEGHDRLTAFGLEVGMVFDFDRIQLGNTFDAHRVAAAARGTGLEEAVVKNLFAAYFTRGELLSDHAVLERAAVDAGMDPGLVQQVLGSDLFAAEVRADERTAQEQDVTGVPYFLINGKWAVPGAQDVDTLAIVLRRAWDRAEVPAT